METEIKRTVLSNGLTVLTREIHKVPVVTTWAWYRVGGRNEVPGITGISHWVEHMQFKGTPTFGKGSIFREVTRNGGTLNGFTWLDFTAYFETLPSDRADLALRIESDRMANSVFDPDEVQSERTVIISEREGNENSPSFLLSEEIAAAAFKVHTYGQGVIGFKSDLRAMTRDDLYNYYRTYYVPNNAIVVAVGDFDTARLLPRVEELFGSIPPSPSIPPVRPVEPAQVGQRRVLARHPGGAQYCEIVFHVPEAASSDIFPLIVLDAVLSGGKGMAIGGSGGARMGRSSRLYRSLVEGGLAASAVSSINLTKDPYLFSLWAILREGVDLAEVERVAFQELQRLCQETVGDEELARAMKQVKAQFVYGAESITDQAYWIGSMETLGVNETVESFLGKVVSVSKSDVQRVANLYLTEDNSTVGWFVPTEGRETLPNGGETEKSNGASKAMFYNADVPEGAAPGKISLQIDRQVLDNGVVVLGRGDRTSPSVVIRVNLKAGSMAESDEQQGLARMTASMLLRGTENRSFPQLNEETDSLGMGLSVESAWQGAQISAKCLSEDFGRAIDIIADVLRHPVFPEEEIDKVRGQMLTSLREQANDTQTVAEKVFREMIYPPGHPYRRWPAGTESVLTSLKCEDLVAFYRRVYRPEICTFSIAGDIAFPEAMAKIREAFGDWRVAGSPVTVQPGSVAPPQGIVRRDVPVPGKTQADLALGLPTLSRKDPDFYALSMANLILGRLGLMGRLGAKVRDEMGLAYYVRSDLDAGLWQSPWSVRAGVNPDGVEKALAAILEEVGRIRSEPVTDSELADAKNFLTGIMPLSLETNEGVARTMMEIELYDLGLDYLERYPEILRGLTKEQLKAAAERYIRPENLALVIAGPTGK